MVRRSQLSGTFEVLRDENRLVLIGPVTVGEPMRFAYAVSTVFVDNAMHWRGMSNYSGRLTPLPPS